MRIAYFTPVLLTRSFPCVRVLQERTHWLTGIKNLDLRSFHGVLGKSNRTLYIHGNKEAMHALTIHAEPNLMLFLPHVHEGNYLHLYLHHSTITWSSVHSDIFLDHSELELHAFFIHHSNQLTHENMYVVWYVNILVGIMIKLIVGPKRLRRRSPAHCDYEKTTNLTCGHIQDNLLLQQLYLYQFRLLNYIQCVAKFMTIRWACKRRSPKCDKNPKSDAV